MTPRKRKATLQKDDPPAKRASKGRAVKKQDDPIWATQNPKSHLVNQDLHAKYCDPATYQNWTKEDWEEIRDCLPENAPYNDDGYSVPMHYFRYDTDWRRLVREFQEDLKAGRYEPQWLKQATLAMEERAAGKFDKFKEDQFEAFWGQKQTLHHDVRAGESAKIKLSQLVEARLIRVGDDLSYRRTFRSKAEVPWMIEKDLKVMAINGTTLTVAIPPGQFRFPRFRPQPESSMIASADNDSTKKEVNQGDKAGDLLLDESISRPRGITTGTETSNDYSKIPSEKSELQTSIDSQHASKVPSPDLLSSNGTLTATDVNAKPDEVQSNAESGALGISMNGEKKSEGTGSVLGTSDAISSSETRIQEEIVGEDKPRPAADEAGEVSQTDETAIDEAAAVGHDSVPNSNEQWSKIESESDCFLYDVWKPNGLENRIIEIDGRMEPKDAPIASSWRSIRVLRNNQDLGSLFDIREGFYISNNPTIVKMPKKGRGKSRFQDDNEEFEDHTEKPRKRTKIHAQEGVTQGTPPSRRKPERSRAVKMKAADVLDDYDVSIESEDEDSVPERDSDGEFEAKATPRKGVKQKSKSGGRPRRSTNQTTNSTLETESAAINSQAGNSNGVHEGEGRLVEIETDDRKPESKHTAWCPYCDTGFTKACNMKTHIRKACKKVPAE